MDFIGRPYEQRLLRKVIDSKKPELGIIYGRRRIGKSTLLKILKKPNEKWLYFEGLQDADTPTQIQHFANQLAQQTHTVPVRATSWKDVFDTLTLHLQSGWRCIVIDELPWMASGRHELISLLKYYWDNHWKNSGAPVLFLCGSIANFMVNHVLHSKALHNRKTFEIHLPPLPAVEAKAFFKDKRALLEITQFLMIFGGVPKYLEQLDPRKNLLHNLDRLCFLSGGFFIHEFETVFKEQFRVVKKYESIIRKLAQGSCTREELAKDLKISPSGGFTSYLDQLERADFIRGFHAIDWTGKRGKTRKYVLWDEWLRFYFTFLEPNLTIIQENRRIGLAQGITQGRLDPYFGLAFERFCMKNFPALLDALEIPHHEVLNYGPFFRQAPRTRKASPHKNSLRIDILIRRKNRIMTLVECRFTKDPVDKDVIAAIEDKLRLLAPPKNWTIEKALVTAAGVTPRLEALEYFDHIATLEDLYTPRA